MRQLIGLAGEILGLQTSRGRLLFFGAASCVIFIVPYSWLDNLSIWQALNIPAPSIGLTRAYWKLLHADPAGAWERNRLIYLVIVIGLPILLRDVWLGMQSKRASEGVTTISRSKPESAAPRP